jgi:hypothetical protein
MLRTLRKLLVGNVVNSTRYASCDTDGKSLHHEKYCFVIFMFSMGIIFIEGFSSGEAGRKRKSRLFSTCPPHPPF